MRSTGPTAWAWRAALCGALLVLGAAAPAARAAFDDPLFVFSPEPLAVPPGVPPPPPMPPPDGYLEGPCGLAVDPTGRIYVADHYHDAVDVFTPGFGYVTQLGGVQAPCGMALDGAGDLYLNRYHGEVAKFGPTPGFAPGPLLDSSRATGVAVDPASGGVYVDDRDHVSAYDSAGEPVLDGGEPLRIGEGTLGDGYGIAVSGYSGTLGRVYVPDAGDDTVKVYDPAVDPVEPVATISGPPSGFTSLRDSAVAVDAASGDVYVVDDTQPAHAEQPEATIQVFDPSGAYQGHLKYNVIDGAPSGLAVDNSPGSARGRVYVTSGNTHAAGIYAYPPGAATGGIPLPPTVPLEPPGGGAAVSQIAVGGAAGGAGGVACEGDSCQSLPPEPVDPTLTTLLPGLGNPKVYYRRAMRNCRGAALRARSAARAARRAAPGGERAARLHRRARRAARAVRRCRRANGPSGRRGSRASSSALASGGVAERRGAPGERAAAEGSAAWPAGPGGRRSSAAATVAGAAFSPIEPGLDAGVWDSRGEPATLAGSHPYELALALGLDQGGGEADLRNLRIDLPPGLLADPSAVSLCSSADFATPRSSSPGPSESGESCPDRSQVGTLELRRAGGQTRRFGIFDLDPAHGAALQLGAAPFGAPLVFDGVIDPGGSGAYALNLRASDIPRDLAVQGLRLTLWGAPWDASHDGERGDCLDEAEPLFPWGKCSVGDPLDASPRAFLTLPTECADSLAFDVQASSWQRPETLSEQALNRDESGLPAPIRECDGLGFAPRADGVLSTRKASSASGFVFRLEQEDERLTDPRARIRSLTKRAVVELPDGVTLNPSLGAGLEACTPEQLAAESSSNPPGSGCPDGSKIGDFSIRSPFYDGPLDGAVYLAQPHDNPFGSLIAVYLVAKSAERGLLIEAAGKLEPDKGDGTLTATLDDLPQLPYTALEVDIRSGQRAPLVSPPACGAAKTQIELTPWSGGAGPPALSSESQVLSGVEGGPCPGGAALPFAPTVTAGGINSNVGSYTPYFVHLARKDTEQEITSYSLTLPKGIVGKLAGVPFCSEAAIAAARAHGGFAETASPSCPAASQVGRTLTGYGVGSALTYAPGRIYLAGPYNGSPLSLVTVNAATVGPFDLGTIVIRSAFAVDPHTAQLSIDSSASDPIPHIIDGIPLHLRDIRVYMDRPEFTRNPTSCEASELQSTLTGDGSDDSTATATASFQLLNCLTLGFRPRLGLRLLGGVRRGAYPGLRAVFRARPGDADLKRIAVTMPRALFLAQNHIRTVCTRVQFAAERCPPGSVYGHAAAQTPLFDEPLRGPVYLRSSDSKLPDLVASLRSGAVRIVLEGRIGPSRKGGIRASFDGLPDAPVDRFSLWLRGGRFGLLVNSVNVCAAPPRAAVKALAQNDRGAIFTTRLRGKCRKLHRSHRGLR